MLPAAVPWLLLLPLPRLLPLLLLPLHLPLLSPGACCCCWLQDEELGVYRQRMQSLNVYCSANNLPKVCESKRFGFGI